MSQIGTIELLATIDTSQYKRGAKEIEKSNSDMESSGDSSSSKMSSAFSSVAKVGLAAVATAAVAVGALVIKNFDNAVKRVDTLNNSSRTFENMGFTASAVDTAMKSLEKSIKGLPTPLDQAVRGVQLLSGATNDVGKAQQIFSALNNAIIGFGGSADDVQGAIVQVSQAFSNGKVDAQTWNSLIQNGLGPVLNALARQMGITTGQLKDGLSEGTISVETFQDSLIKLNKEGGGGLKSLEKISKDATSGIGTGWANLNTSITRGISSIIEAIGAENISNAISSFGTNFENALKSVGDFFRENKEIIKTGFTTISDVVKQVSETFKQALVSLAPYKDELILVAKVVAAVLAGAILGAIVVFGKIIEYTIKFTVALIEMWAWIINTASAIGQFAIDLWNSITNALSQIPQWFTDRFTEAKEGVKSAFGSLFGWFTSLWNQITGLFTSVGTTVGNAIGNSFKNVINSVLRGAINIINGFIRSINNVVGIINKIPGVDIGKIGELSVPQLAQGGIVSSPTLAMIGEGRESEAVIPLSKLDKMLSSPNNRKEPPVVVNLRNSKSAARQIALETIDLINEGLRAKSLPQIGVVK